MIRIRDLRVDYDNVCAVRDLSLEVEPGEVCGLIGPNGAGKTTTMRAMLGLIEPTYGEIEVMGVDVRERPQDVCRMVGFMPDFPPVYEDLLVWEFLDLFAASYGMPRHRRPGEVGRHLEMVGLAEKREALVVELSRGMRQRLMLAKTLIPDPRVLLLDEPASGVDPQGRIDLKNILRRLADEGKTVLISSHILAEMNEFCTSVAIMERGRLVVSGRIDEVNRRVMGDSLLSVEVLGEPELFLSIVGADERAGPIERKNGAYEFRFRRRRRGGQRAAGDSGAARACASPRSSAAGTTWKTCSSRSGRRSCRDELGPGLRDWLDNPIFVKHVRSRLRMQPLARGDRGRAGRSACASPGRDTSSTRSRPAARSAGCCCSRSSSWSSWGRRRSASSVGGARASGILDFHRVSPADAGRADARLLLRRTDPRICPVRRHAPVRGALPGVRRPQRPRVRPADDPPDRRRLAFPRPGALERADRQARTTARGGVVGVVVFSDFLRRTCDCSAGRSPSVALVDTTAADASSASRCPGWPVVLIYVAAVLFFIYLAASAQDGARSGIHPLSKPQAIAALVTLRTLVLGGIWQTGRYEVLQHRRALPAGDPGDPAAPDGHAHAGRVCQGPLAGPEAGPEPPPWWDDLSLNRVFLLIACAIVLVTATLAWHGSRAPAGRRRRRNLWLVSPGHRERRAGGRVFRPGACSTSCSGLARRGMMYFALFLFSGWVVPLVGGTILSMASDVARPASGRAEIIFSLSPMADRHDRAHVAGIEALPRPFKAAGDHAGSALHVRLQQPVDRRPPTGP